MKRIGIITFHASYNYGSMLQNYALQQILFRLGYDVETINYRSRIQKEQYSPFMPFWELKDKRRILLSLINLPYRRSLSKKAQLFEKFLSDNIILTEECQEEQQLKKLHSYDIYLAGSDQIWNWKARDFSWCYLLDFVAEDKPKVSYATSMGPNLCNDIDSHYKDLLNKFCMVSVRDKNTYNVIHSYLQENKYCGIHLDPTLLLDAETYSPNITLPHVDGKFPTDGYIFMYNPYFLRDVYEQARKLSQLTGLKVVVSNTNLKSTVLYPDFKKVLECGPWEFLWLLKNANYVIGRSFHLIVFSILFKKNFFAVNGMGDSRICDLLIKMGLEKRATDVIPLESLALGKESIDYEMVFKKLNEERKASMEYLRNLQKL